jgi:prolyl oligopeptidase
LRAALDASDRIPAITRAGAFVYNFWQDGANKRGLWRRTTLADYRKDEPAWQLLLDLDALATAEGENWVWHGATCLAPDYRRCLMHLSRGGADAVVVREYDVEARAFVDGGFTLPEAKSDVVWEDADHVFVGTDFGPGSLTDSGYPRVIKRWQRGTPLAQARTVYEGKASDVSAWVSVERSPGLQRVLVGRSPDFFSNEVFHLHGDKLSAVAKPVDAELSFHRDWALMRLRSDLDLAGKHHVSGSLLAAPAAAVLAGQARWQAVFTPTPTRALDHFVWTRHHLVLNVLDQVANRVEALTWQATGANGHWQRSDVKLPGPGTLSLAALDNPWLADDALADHLLVSYVDFTTPDTLYLVRAEAGSPERLKQRKPQFDASGMQVEQRHATSKDGTQVPYFIVWPRGAALSASVPGGAPRPTLLYGYGGFEISMQPWYSAAWGLSWYERGGVLVVANIRGGGEFGPAWHQAAVKANKQRSYDDFIAIAEDLIRRGVTDTAHLGIMGGSNGGLLVGAAFTQRPDLFKAVVCQVPLLDMRRFHKLLAGASWMAEYGDPDDPAQWAWISKYSPYQNLDATRTYPRVLFTTSTRDDRVHPGHARKMVARLRELGKPVLYYENTEGGHGGAADNEQRAHLLAMEFAYLWEQLGDVKH